MASLALARRGRTAALGVLLLAAAGAAYVFASAKRSTDTVREVLAAKELKLVKYREKLLEKEAAAAELSVLTNTLRQIEAGLLTGETPSLAAAEVQEIVTTVANASGAQIKTIRVLQPEPLPKQAYAAIPVEVTLSSTLRELTELLYRLEGSAKLLRVSRMEIKALGGRPRAGAPEGLVTTLTVEGFAKKAGNRG